MNTLKLTLQPLAPFATPLAGDTLFGHLCWAARERHGEASLREWLGGYTDGDPFLVVSDGFPEGLVPRPSAPDFVLGIAADPALRKRARAQRWVPAEHAGEPLARWMQLATGSDVTKTGVLTQNTINRYTGTTGENQFAPRQVERTFFNEETRLEVYAVLDEARLSAAQLRLLFEVVGAHGYGRDATTGLGKFTVEAIGEHSWPGQNRSHRQWLTLAPCAPEADALSAEACFYLPLTRFGRHGNIAATMQNPFKQPLLMIATGALLASRGPAHWLFHGRGLGGPENPLSQVIPETVHQGYAPVVPVRIESGR